MSRSSFAGGFKDGRRVAPRPRGVNRAGARRPFNRRGCCGTVTLRPETSMAEPAALKDYTRFAFTDPQGRWTRPVYRKGSGPAVIIIHEMPGLHPLVLRFADRVAAAGMTVFCPVLF